ncbi:MAG: ATP-binding protein [Paludibacteraceae bacterium]|nr:ATP-binding protein [Paludibacteraceae bacterium]
MIIRDSLQCIIDRMNEPRRFIQVLAGPRQVGKSTMISQFIQQTTIPVTSVNADAIAPDNKEWIAEQWSKARTAISIYNEPEHILIIDEIQKIDNWSEVVKREWDADTQAGLNLKVILLGSSRLMLKDGLTESLAGRFELIRITHWSFPEMEKAFGMTLNQYIYYGGFPGAASLIGNERRWRNYVRDSILDPAIDKDVLMTKKILKPALLRQTFELGCAYSGELLSYNKIAGQLQDAGNTATIASYINTLGEANLVGGLQKYSIDTARKYMSVPKFQVYNNALMTIQNGRGFEKELLEPQRWGRWVESAVGAHIVNHADELDYKVYYWRDHADEVDFIISTRFATMAIEVKSGRRTTNKGLRTFSQLFHPKQTMIVGSGGFSVEEFLRLDMDRIISLIDMRSN